MREGDFWVGVFAGFVTTTILAIMILTVHNKRMTELSDQFKALQVAQQEQRAWIEESRTIMQTYKFFNESWEAIINYDEGKKISH
jgi:hypothetical protein